MLRDFIARIRNVAVAIVAVAAVGIAPLSACGVKGPLKLPPAPATGARPADSPAVAGAGNAHRRRAAAARNPP